jgi:hypothetical protein
VYAALYTLYAKLYERELNPDKQVNIAVVKGLSRDRSEILGKG